MRNEEHARLHARQRPTRYIELTCSVCGNEFKRSASHYKSRKRHGQNRVMCSKRCVGLYAKRFFPKKKHSQKYVQIVKEGLKKNLTGYQISKEHNLCKATVYNIIKQITS